MKIIRFQYVLLAFACQILVCCCLGAALFSPWLLIPCGLALAAFFWVDKRFLRCPCCGGHNGLDKLFLAKRRPFHCVHCWERIIVK